MTLDQITAITPANAPNTYTWSVPDGWQQGRGVFGGLIAAALIRAAYAQTDDPARQLRSIMITMCGPVMPGEATLRATTLREGTGLSTLSIALEQGGQIQAQATALLGKRRVEDGDWDELTAPPMPPWQDLPLAPLAPPLAPVFSQHLEYRIGAHPPFASADHGAAAGWIRPLAAGGLRDDAFIAAMADAWWPALYARLAMPRPTATIAYTLDITGTLDGLDPELPLYHDARVLHSRDGYSVEERRLWGHDGRLVAINHQTFAIIK
jgi:acyl-CoA thioesterase